MTGYLMQVNQGSQLRSYKYDSAGRLLYEKTPEQSATINDGTGAFWSSKYTYTTSNAVATKQDARGVIATYSYDSLNRVNQVSYNTVSGVTTAPTVTYAMIQTQLMAQLRTECCFGSMSARIIRSVTPWMQIFGCRARFAP